MSLTQNKRIFFSVMTFLMIAGFIAFALYFFKNTHKKAEKSVSTTLTTPVTSAGGGHGSAVRVQPVSDRISPVTPALGKGRGTGIQRTQSTRTDKVIDPQTASNVLASVRDLVDKREYSEAIKVVDDLLALDLQRDTRDKALLERGRLLTALDRKMEALEVLSSLLYATADDEVFRSARAKYFILCRELGILDEHISNKERELKDNPEDLRLMKIVAYMYQYLPDIDREVALREILVTKATDIENLKRLVTLYEQKNDWTLLANTYARLAEADRNIAFVCLGKKAEAEVKGNRNEDAQATCAKMLAAKELDTPQKASIARILGIAGDNQQALKILNDCLQQVQSPADREQYLLETYRMKIALGQRDHTIRQGLTDLCVNGLLRGTRIGATNLLKQIEQ